MDRALQLGKLLTRSGALLHAGQPDVVDDVMGTASEVVADLPENETAELYAFLYGFFAACVAYGPAEYASIFQTLHMAPDDPAAKRDAIIGAITTARHLP